MRSTAGHPREHHWDAIRALLMLLGIPYHAALSYQPDREWIVHSGEGTATLATIAEFLHLFRMPAFFIVAGYFAALLLARRAPGEWFSGRVRRLGLPLAASLVLLVPAMNLICELSALPPGAAVASWLHNSATSGGYWVRHLWFLIVLLYCCAVAALAMSVRPSLRTAVVPPAIDAWMARNFLTALASVAILIGVWEAVAIELFYMAGLASNLWQEILRIEELIAYAPWFAVGVLIARSRRTLDRFGRISPAVSGVAAVATVAALASLNIVHPMIGRFLSTIAAVALSQLLIATARRMFDRPNSLVDRLVSASFVIYLFHVPVMVLLVAIGQPIAMPVTAKAIVATLLAFVLTYAAARIVARSAWLATLFNGAPIRMANG